MEENTNEVKNYKVGRKLTEFRCDYCGKSETKPTSEYNRNIRLGKRNFCSRSCAASSNRDRSKKQNLHSNSEENKSHLKSICNNKEDEYTLFRYTLRNIKKRFKEFNLTLEYLKSLWEEQKGICPYSKVSLVLPTYKNTVKDIRYRASLDRIDSSKGYIEGNVQFISTSINYLKGEMSHKDTIEFLQIISTNLSFDKDQTISSSQKEMSDAQAGN